MFRHSLLAALLVGGLMTGAQAATIGSSLLYKSESEDGLVDGRFQSFDPSLGTLNSATVTTILYVDTHFLYPYRDEVVSPNPANVVTRFFVDSFGGLQLSDVQQSTAALTENQGYSFANVSAATGLIGTFSTSVFPVLQDGGGIDVRYSAYSTFNGYFPNNPGSYSTVSVNSTITFDYTPVPEPASFALLGVGLAATLVRRRKLNGRQA